MQAPRPDPLLIPLMSLGNFVIGVAGFSIIGILEPLGTDMNRSAASAGQLMTISADYSLPVTVYVLGTLGLGLALGHLLGAAQPSSQLIASGTAICGGTTIASLSPVIGARAEQTGVALTLVFLLNAVAAKSVSNAQETDSPL